MPVYVYWGKVASGEKIQGQVQAESFPEAMTILESRGTVGVEEMLPLQESRLYNVRLRECQVALLYEHLAGGIASGLPLPEAVRVSARESPDRRVRAVAQHLWEDIQAGCSLSEAMERFPRCFSHLHRTIIASAEEANALDMALKQLAAHSDAVARTSRALVLALAYPAAVSVFGLGIITFMLTFILPKFMAMFKDLGVKEMPATTQFLLDVSRWWTPILCWGVAIVILAYTIRFYTSARRGSITADRWKLKLPVLGPFFFHLTHARLAGTLAILVDKGVSLAVAVRLAASAAGNRTVESGWRRAANLVEEGVPLAEALEECGGVPEVLASRIAVGEEAGTLPEALNDAAEYYTQRAEASARQVGPVLEPLFIAIVGICIGLIVFGMISPLLCVVNGLAGGSDGGG